MSIDKQQIEAFEIEQLLPHRYPMLMVDRVLSWEADKKITALKNVSVAEPHFVGHFPGYPIMPGVLIVEAMAQTSGLLMFLGCKAELKDAKVYLAGITKARFKRQVIPGDSLIFECSLIRKRVSFAQFDCEAKVDGNLVCKSELLIAIDS